MDVQSVSRPDALAFDGRDRFIVYLILYTLRAKYLLGGVEGSRSMVYSVCWSQIGDELRGILCALSTYVLINTHVYD